MNLASFGRVFLRLFALETWIQRLLTRCVPLQLSLVSDVDALCLLCSWLWKIPSEKVEDREMLLGKFGSQLCFVTMDVETIDSGQQFCRYFAYGCFFCFATYFLSAYPILLATIPLKRIAFRFRIVTLIHVF